MALHDTDGLRRSTLSSLRPHPQQGCLRYPEAVRRNPNTTITTKIHCPFTQNVKAFFRAHTHLLRLAVGRQAQQLVVAQEVGAGAGGAGAEKGVAGALPRGRGLAKARRAPRLLLLLCLLPLPAWRSDRWSVQSARRVSTQISEIMVASCAHTEVFRTT